MKSETINGSLLRVNDGRSVAIYLRDGIAWVAEFRGSRGRLLSVGEWHCFHARGVAHAQRRGEVEILSPIPGDAIARIEALHRRLGELNDHPLRPKTAIPAALAVLWSRLARTWPNPAALGSRMIGAPAFRVD